jgi:L-2-hydroxyglutarate oxidase LhgO
MFKVEAVVIGAGVIGLAIARSLALRGVQVLLIEKEASPGTGTSSRNSEVIHAGLYYEPESLKARLCVRGAACCIAIAMNDMCLTAAAAHCRRDR